MRYLKTPRSAFSNVGRLAFFGLVISVLVLVVVLSVVNGFEREMKERVLTMLPNLSAQFANGLGEEEVDALDKLVLPEVEAWAPQVQGNVLLVSGETIQGALLTGIDETYVDVAPVMAHLEGASEVEFFDSRFGLVLGAGVARELGVIPGDSVRVVLPAAGTSMAGAIPRQKQAPVIGIFRSQSLLDTQAAFMPLNDAQKLFRTQVPQGLHFRLTDLFNVRNTALSLFQQFGDEVRLRSWMDAYGNLYRAIAVQKTTMFVLLLFLMSVSAFNLISGLVMIVEQRRGDIAILMTMGFARRDVLLTFVCLGLGMAFAGICLGLLSGVLIALSLPGLFGLLNDGLGLNLMSQYFIAYLPVDVRSLDLLVVAGISLLLAFLAALFPAWRASRTYPSQVLNHE